MNRRFVLVSGATALLMGASTAQSQSPLSAEVDHVYAESEALYKDLHQHPELSSRESATAAKLAEQLKQLGFDVTTGVGGTGVVGVMKNGPGPTVLLRTELDALPVTEKTGVAFASTVRTTNPSGVEVGVMHACGHDAHMAAWRGTAAIMAQNRKKWSGTLVLIGQPAEETGAGAKAMIADGLLTRFPRPDYAIAVHDDARLQSGLISYRAGPVMTNVDAVTVHIFGRGGHGARPETTIDPIVIAARTIVALQTIVSREMSPFDPSVVTVGSIHGGTTHNVIPDEVVLQLTVRSFTNEVRQHLLSSIARIVKAEALAAGATKEPTIERAPTAESLVNDSALTRKVGAALVRVLGRERVVEGQAEMVGEDFSEFPIAGIPSLQMRVGAVDPKKYADAVKSDIPLPSLHSSTFFPDTEPTIKSAMSAEVIALRELMPPRK
jgi:hippurate hydrolase